MAQDCLAERALNCCDFEDFLFISLRNEARAARAQGALAINKDHMPRVIKRGDGRIAAVCEKVGHTPVT